MSSGNSASTPGVGAGGSRTRETGRIARRSCGAPQIRANDDAAHRLLDRGDLQGAEPEIPVQLPAVGTRQLGDLDWVERQPVETELDGGAHGAPPAVCLRVGGVLTPGGSPSGSSGPARVG